MLTDCRMDLQLKDKRYKFAINNNLPKHYVNIINSIQANSDDKQYPKKGVYIVKKLPLKLATATEFFQCLNKVMKDADKDEGERAQG